MASRTLCCCRHEQIWFWLVFYFFFSFAHFALLWSVLHQFLRMRNSPGSIESIESWTTLVFAPRKYTVIVRSSIIDIRSPRQLLFIFDCTRRDSAFRSLLLFIVVVRCGREMLFALNFRAAFPCNLNTSTTQTLSEVRERSCGKNKNKWKVEKSAKLCRLMNEIWSKGTTSEGERGKIALPPTSIRTKLLMLTHIQHCWPQLPWKSIV